MSDAVDIAALFSAIKTKVAEQFLDLEVYAVASKRQPGMKIPCCMLNVDDFEKADEDLGTEQLSVVLRFEASLILGAKNDTAKQQAVLLALAFATFIDGQRWGVKVGEAQFESASPDEFSPELDKYEVWTVAWAQEVTLGESIWTNDGTLPQTVLVSTSPEIGEPNEDKYKEVTGL